MDLDAFSFHGVLVKDFRLEGLHMVMLFVFEIYGLDEEVFCLRYHVLFAVGVLLLLDPLAGCGQSHDFIVVAVG